MAAGSCHFLEEPCATGNLGNLAPKNVHPRLALRTIENSKRTAEIFKALVFGLVIAIVSCSEGLRTSGGAVGVGRATRRSVILCYLLILVFGYFGTAIFYGKGGGV